MDIYHLSMLKSRYIHKKLAYLTFSWLNSCDKNWRFPVWNERFMNDIVNNKQNNNFYHHLQHHRADYLCGIRYIDDDINDINDHRPSFNDVMDITITSNSINNKYSVKYDTVSFQEKILIKNKWKNMHFASNTLKSLSLLIKKCTKLTSLTLKCFYGVNIEDFKDLIDIISTHSVIDDLQIHALQSRKE